MKRISFIIGILIAIMLMFSVTAKAIYLEPDGPTAASNCDEAPYLFNGYHLVQTTHGAYCIKDKEEPGTFPPVPISKEDGYKKEAGSPETLKPSDK